MNFLISFCLLATVALASGDLSPELTSYVDSLFETKAITTLASSDNSHKSLTGGGSTEESIKIHNNAISVLSAYSKMLNSAEHNETTKNLMARNYHVKELYCPKKNYDYYKCNDQYKYRSFDGSCNNFYVPWWGKRETPYARILKPEYDDRINEPRTMSVVDYEYLPNPRTVAMKIHSAKRTFPETTQLMTFFGQNVFHDLIFTARSSYKYGEEKNCRCGSRDKDCHNIPIPYDDYYNRDQRCLPLTRSSAAIENFDCKFSYREQLNLVTHWLDLSNIYGSSVKVAKKLRKYKHGLMKTSVNPVNGSPDLPRNGKKSCDGMFTMEEKCYKTGDNRAEDNIYLTMFNRIFLNEHNRIAKELYYLNPSWDDEYLFQEARKINIAEYQHIIYYEFLPMILGGAAMNKWGLIPTPPGYYFNHYNKDTNPQVKNAFAVAAARFGHTLVNKFHYVYNSNYDLVDNYTTDYLLFTHTYYGDYSLRGAYLGNSYYFTPAVNEYMNNYLFEGMSKNYKRLSLSALNIQRGREHGLPGYNKYRKWCGLNYAYSFDELTNIPSSVRNELKYLYKSVDDIDAFTGMMSEYAVEDGVVGPTAACILGDGFHDWKYGDRFWYETNDKMTGFAPHQLREVKKTSLARILCDNSDVEFIQYNPFLEANPKTNELIDCKNLRTVNLSAWKRGNYKKY